EYSTAQNTQYSKTFTFASNVASVKFSMAGVYAKPYKVEYGSTATDWVPNQTDSTYELAQYKQTIDTQLTSLQRTTQTNANNIETNKTTIETTVNGIKTDISALQTYVNEDGTRTTAMQTYVKDENAKQTTALRTEVSNTYASKAQVTQDISGLTAKYENIRVGSRNYVLKSDFYMTTGSPNLFVNLSTDFSKNANGKTIVLSYEVESSNLSLRASGNRYGFEIKISFTDGTAGYYGLWMSGTTALTNRRVIKSYNLPPDKVVSKVEYGIMSIQIDGTIKIGRPKLKLQLPQAIGNQLKKMLKTTHQQKLPSINKLSIRTMLVFLQKLE
ncbi:hypothetical protein MXZ84_09975, partial [Streptococcus uberis]